MKQLVIIGASGHGKVVADIARLRGYDWICFLDDNEALFECNGYPVNGISSSYINYNCDFAVAIGNPLARQGIMQMLHVAGKNTPVLIHPNAVIGERVELEVGTVVAAGVVINPAVKIGKGCIINTCSSVDHDCNLGNYVHVAVGAHIAGGCSIGEKTWIGAGATISNNLTICSDCMIGVGAVVVRDLITPGTYVGVPARMIK